MLPDTGEFDPLQRVTLTLEDMFGSEGLPGKNPETAYFLSLERLRESAARQEKATNEADQDTTPWPPIPPTPRSPQSGTDSCDPGSEVVTHVSVEPSDEVANQDISKLDSETSDELNRDDLGFSVPARNTQLGTPFGAPLSPPLSPSTLGPGLGRKTDFNNQQSKRKKSSGRRKPEKSTKSSKCKPCRCEDCQRGKLPIFERISSYAAEVIAAAKDSSSKKAKTKSSEEVPKSSFFPSEKRSDVLSAASTQHETTSETGFLQEEGQDRQVIIDLLDNLRSKGSSSEALLTRKGRK